MKIPRVLVAFNTLSACPPDKDYAENFRQPDWQTEADVTAALRELDCPVDFAGIFDDTSIFHEKIKTFKPDVIFNLVERFKNNSAHEADVTAFLKLLGVPFTGCGPEAMMLCKDKGLSKQILSHHRVRVPQFALLPVKKLAKRPRWLDLPIFIKPLKEEASLGISQASFVENDAQFEERVKFIHETMGLDVIAEEYIDGRELYVSVTGNQRLEVFPIREMVFSNVPDEEPKIATYKAKWDETYRKKWGIHNRFAEGLSKDTLRSLEKFCKKIYRVLCIHGYARLDLRLRENGEIFFIEANPNPMLAKDEDFALSAQKAGFEYPALIQKILNLASVEEE